MSITDSQWQRRIGSLLLVSDLIVILVTLVGTQWAWYGLDKPVYFQLPGQAGYETMPFAIPVTTLLLLWLFFLWAYKTRDAKILGTGTAEYKRVADATIRVWGIFAIFAFVLNFTIGQGYLLTGLPAGLLLIIASRWCIRQWLKARRRRGAYKTRAILFGDQDGCTHVARQIAREQSAGIAVLGAVCPDGTPGDTLVGSIPILGTADHLADVLRTAAPESLIMTGADSIGPREMRELGWQLEEANVNLIVSPSLTDVAGPRIHSSPVAGLPLIHVDFPDTKGPKLWVKRAFDIVFSGFALLIFSPLFLALTIIVRTDSPGPALFRQERVGLNGKTFKMLKFRSMVIGAEGMLASLLDESDGNGVMFKKHDDPRITRSGRILRRYSLDELPQLINVFRGEMSLVGPRPPLPEEVAQYDHWAERRLLVKPGITGLWQVSGRSNLDWDDTVRLDLYYVENWSLTGDLAIIMRTITAVLRREGAY